MWYSIIIIKFLYFNPQFCEFCPWISPATHFRFLLVFCFFFPFTISYLQHLSSQLYIHWHNFSLFLWILYFHLFPFLKSFLNQCKFLFWLEIAAFKLHVFVNRSQLLATVSYLYSSHSLFSSLQNSPLKRWYIYLSICLYVQSIPYTHIFVTHKMARSCIIITLLLINK